MNVYCLNSGDLVTFQVHANHEALAETAGGAVLPADLVYDAVIPPGAQIIVLPCEGSRECIMECHYV